MRRRLLLLGALAAPALALLPVRGRAEPPALLPPDQRADLVLVEKAARRLTLLRGGEPLATYRVALGFAPEGHKTEEGDGRTPEGRYTLDWKNAASRFHLSLHVDYPNAADRAQAKARGVSPGGEIFVHGGSWRGSSRDWTLGCVAVTDAEIEAIWARVAPGTPIEIRP